MKFFTVLLAFTVCAHAVFAVEDQALVVPQSEIKVVLVVSPPFVMEKSPGVYTGFSIELWEKIATALKVKFTYSKCESIPKIFQTLQANQADIAVFNVVVTSNRLKTVDFSQPYLNGGLQVMVSEDRKWNFSRFLQSMISYGFIEIFIYGSMAVIATSIIVTVVRRKFVKEFTQHWHEGAADSFYHVMSVAMTGKTNYKGPLGTLGKIFAGLWMICGVGVVAYITSTVTSVMTANKLLGEIHGVQDLNNKLVGVAEGSAAETYCSNHQMYVKPFSKPLEAVDDLVNHNIQAIVAESSQLQYFDKMHPELPITEVGAIFNDDKYAFALPKQSALLQPLNVEMLLLQESGYVAELKTKYFGNP